MPARLIYDRATLRADVAALQARLPGIRLFYAAKACAEPLVLGELAAHGLGFEVASAEENKALLDIGVGAQDIICGLPMKGPDLIADMYAKGCRAFAFDCPEEHADLLCHAPSAVRLLRIAVQDLDSTSIGWGMSPDTLDAWVAESDGVLAQIDGVSFHLSRNYRPKLLERVLDRAGAVLDRLQGTTSPILNIGGGYRNTLPPHLALKFDLERFYRTVTERLGCLRARHSIRVWAEPGRALVERAGSLQTRVLQVRAAAHEHVVALELNIGTKPGAHPSAISAVTVAGREPLYSLDAHLRGDTGEMPTVMFVDATCEFAPFYRLPLCRVPRVGELLEFQGLGAYTGCLSSRFHRRAFPNVTIA